MPKTFDLMFCCLGNGVTVADRLQTACNDYRNVAHIADTGDLRIYDQRLLSDPAAMAQILHHAAALRADFRKLWFSLPYQAQYQRWYDSMSLPQLLTARNDTPADKPSEWLYSAYLSNHARRHGYTPLETFSR